MTLEAIAGADVEQLREQLEKCARRFHDLRQVENAREHKFWKFENCPGEACREARKALGMPDAIMPPIGQSSPPAREPGQEG